MEDPSNLRVLREIGSPALLGGVWPGEDSVSLKVMADRYLRPVGNDGLS